MKIDEFRAVIPAETAKLHGLLHGKVQFIHGWRPSSGPSSGPSSDPSPILLI
ncbi:hypothetical protein ANO14919_112410 [Xylariales sp. No.14919]|nr:hypothetical protein ANO14919_112410 [Xylariales sp. No.14919]